MLLIGLTGLGVTIGGEPQGRRREASDEDVVVYEGPVARYRSGLPGADGPDR